MIRILIVDDHPIFRQGLIRIITNNTDMTVTGEAIDGTDALNKIKENEYDLVLLDISMPGKDGLDVIKEIKGLYPKLAVLVLTMHPENQYAMRMFKSGASGYLTKERAPDELIDAIRIWSGGGKYISPSMTANIITEWGRN